MIMNIYLKEWRYLMKAKALVSWLLLIREKERELQGLLA